MKKMSFIILFLLLCMAGCTGQKLISLEGMSPDAPSEIFYIDGNDCKWSPDRIEVKKGTHVIIEVASLDRDVHFRLHRYDLRFRIPQGKRITAEFYAHTQGEFEFGCSIGKDPVYLWEGRVGNLIVK
jgi:hypothetical protein